MDLLFQRYASPFILLNGYIANGKLCYFINNFIKKSNEEKEEKATWEFFLHKEWEKSYSEFLEDVNNNKINAEQTEADMEATIKNSLSVLGRFNPET